jgi:hypothetical protein
MQIDIAHIVLMAAAGFLSVVMSLLAWAMKGLIDDAKGKIGTHDRKLEEHADRLNEHGRKISVLEVRTDSHQSAILEHQRELNHRT